MPRKSKQRKRSVPRGVNRCKHSTIKGKRCKNAVNFALGCIDFCGTHAQQFEAGKLCVDGAGKVYKSPLRGGSPPLSIHPSVLKRPLVATSAPVQRSRPRKSRGRFG